jgi:phenylacetate-CoA ligase
VVDNADGQDRMTLNCEVDSPSELLLTSLAASIREITKLRGEVVFCASGSLPNDGKVIEDIRTYE